MAERKHYGGPKFLAIHFTSEGECLSNFRSLRLNPRLYRYNVVSRHGMKDGYVLSKTTRGVVEVNQQSDRLSGRRRTFEYLPASLSIKLSASFSPLSSVQAITTWSERGEERRLKWRSRPLISIIRPPICSSSDKNGGIPHCSDGLWELGIAYSHKCEGMYQNEVIEGHFSQDITNMNINEYNKERMRQIQ